MKKTLLLALGLFLGMGAVYALPGRNVNGSKPSNPTDVSTPTIPNTTTNGTCSMLDSCQVNQIDGKITDKLKNVNVDLDKLNIGISGLNTKLDHTIDDVNRHFRTLSGRLMDIRAGTLSSDFFSSRLSNLGAVFKDDYLSRGKPFDLTPYDSWLGSTGRNQLYESRVLINTGLGVIEKVIQGNLLTVEDWKSLVKLQKGLSNWLKVSHNAITYLMEQNNLVNDQLQVLQSQINRLKSEIEALKIPKSKTATSLLMKIKIWRAKTREPVCEQWMHTLFKTTMIKRGWRLTDGLRSDTNWLVCYKYEGSQDVRPWDDCFPNMVPELDHSVEPRAADFWVPLGKVDNGGNCQFQRNVWFDVVNPELPEGRVNRESGRYSKSLLLSDAKNARSQ